MGWKEKRFGLLTIISTPKTDVFLCRCKCGKEVRLWRSQLDCNVVRHCGCRGRFKVRSVEQKHFRQIRRKDGRQRKFHTSELHSYLGMKARCCYGNNSEYRGRGIRVCDRWLEPNPKGFQNFLDDMGPRPAHMTLDRINVQGHYEPGNCRWATDTEQRWNQRRLLFDENTPAPPVEKIGVMNERVERTYDHEPEAIY